MNTYIKTLLVFCGLILAIPVVWFFQNPGSLFAFGPRVQDFSKNLTGGYKLYRNSAHEIFIAPADGWNSEITLSPPRLLK